MRRSASCASVAGAKKLALRGIIDIDESVVCVLTGNLLKDVDTTLAYHESRIPGSTATAANPPVVIDADADALRAALPRYDGRREA